MEERMDCVFAPPVASVLYGNMHMLAAPSAQIVWPEQQTLVKQTVAVVVITAIIGVLISAVDSAALQALNLLIK